MDTQDQQNNGTPGEETATRQERRPRQEKKRNDEQANENGQESGAPEEKKDQTQRQNRGRRQPNRKEDGKQAKADRETDPSTQGAAADLDGEEKTQRPKTTRGRGNRRDAEAAENGVEGEETKGRARSNRRRKNKPQSAVVDGEEVEEEKKGQAKRTNDGNQNKEKKQTDRQRQEKMLEKKRQTMKHQYEPYVAKRVYNSKFIEYQQAVWRQRRNNLFVTNETIVPPMPKKPLQEPDDAQYHLEVAAVNDQIEKLQDEFKDLAAEQHETRATMKEGQNGRNPIRDELRELFGELDTYNKERKERFAEIEKIESKIQQTDRELQKQRKNVHPVYNEEDKLISGIKELERRLATNNWGKQDEMKLIKEIEQVKESRPFFKKIEKVRAQITQLKEDREAIRQAMAPTNKIINSLRDKITKVKSNETVFDKDKQLKGYELTNIKVKIEGNLEKQKSLRDKKKELKEDFYGKMCEFEIEQAMIKDIEWISQTKTMVAEKDERDQKYKLEREERNKENKRQFLEREKVRAEIKARNDAYQNEQKERQREWDQQQLEKLDRNPFEAQISLCEELIYFCAKNIKKHQEAENVDDQEEEAETEVIDETAAQREKRLLEEVKKGTIEVAKTKQERDQESEMNTMKMQKKQRRKRDGPSAFYYEDEDRVDLSYAMIQKFGGLELSPPTEKDHLENTNKQLVALRNALRLKGDLEQTEGRAKFSRDEKLTESEEYLDMLNKFKETDSAVLKSIDKIKNAIRFARQKNEEGDENEDYDRRPRRDDGRGRGGRGGERGRGRGNRGGNERTQRRGRDFEDEEEEQPRKRQQANKGPREKIGGNMDDYPSL